MDNAENTTAPAESRPSAAAPREPLKQKENVFQAEYLGSGTFHISKPRRRPAKRRQSALKNRRRGSRK